MRIKQTPTLPATHSGNTESPIAGIPATAIPRPVSRNDQQQERKKDREHSHPAKDEKPAHEPGTGERVDIEI